ncbi:hypothetical protein CGSHi22121_08173 [Haemophilus influenzae 22.1-21]|nr:hypothetical protein CGSHi22121_08173 [Haemophilus influenzae 22.1-21]
MNDFVGNKKNGIANTLFHFIFDKPMIFRIILLLFKDLVLSLLGFLFYREKRSRGNDATSERAY